MIIGQFNDSFPPVMDGVANVTKNYAYWLNKKYGDCYVITPSFPKYKDNENFEVIRYFSLPLVIRRPYRLGIPRTDFRLRRKLSEIPFNIMHAHSPFSSGKLALRIAKKRGIPIVATFHSKFYDDFKTVVKSDALAELGVKQVVDFFNAVDLVWTVNKATAETLKEYGFKGKIDIIYNGTDFTPPSDFENRRAHINKLLKINPQETVFLFVGQHIWQKNLKMLIQSLKYIQEWGLDYKMIFVGTGYAEHAMKEQVKELGLNERVIFKGSILDREFLKSLYARADLFLFPSIYDNAPIVIREAGAIKCPSVVIKNSNSAEGLTDNFNGFVAQNNSESFAKRVMEILSDQELLIKVGKNAQKTIYKPWEQIIDEVAVKYREIIEEYKQKDRLSVI